MLSRIQFDVLSTLATSKGKLTQRQLEECTQHSLGSINKAMKELSQSGFVDHGAITSSGLDALEPYRAKRAVFIAAGFGSRLVPVTLNTPKPLVRVNGKRIIDGLIEACLDAGISEIYIVRGYLAEQFDQLLYKYPMLKFLENPAYNEANNISSAMVARYLLQNAYVLESDIVVNNPGIIRKYHYTSDFLCVKTQRTDDWCVQVKDGVIVDEKVGGEGDNIWRLYGISYWNGADGRRLCDDLADVYQSPGGKERYWEQVPLVFCKDHYKVAVRDCSEGDVIEIDTFRELKELDHTYDV